jgi:fructose-1-phosphate kinase PfkB-like protein
MLAFIETLADPDDPSTLSRRRCMALAMTRYRAGGGGIAFAIAVSIFGVLAYAIGA